MPASSGVTNNGIKYKTASVYCQNGDDERWMTGERTLTIKNVPINLKTLNKCSSVSLVEIVSDKQLWIATYQVGGHGPYGAEGIVVQELKNGKLISRINSIKGLFTGMYPDPYTKNMWVTSQGAVYEINSSFNVVLLNKMSHDFSPNGLPRFTLSSQPEELNDFSVMSRLIAPASRKKFYDVVFKIPSDERSKFKLYDFLCRAGPAMENTHHHFRR